MISLTFPDGASWSFESGISGLAVAGAIAKSLAKNAVAWEVDGELRDLTDTLDRDAAIRIVTRDDPAAVDLIRHDCAHVLAEAVQALFPALLNTQMPRQAKPNTIVIKLRIINSLLPTRDTPPPGIGQGGRVTVLLVDSQ